MMAVLLENRRAAYSVDLRDGRLVGRWELHLAEHWADSRDEMKVVPKAPH